MGIRDEEEIGVIQKIQGKTGCLLLLMGFALLAFILIEFISARSITQADNPIGEIAGESIDYVEFNNAVEQRISQYKLSDPNLPITPDVKSQIREIVWNEFIRERTTEVEYEKLGIGIPADEWEDITLINPHPAIVQQFPGKDGKGFNKAGLTQFLTQDMQEDENKYITWLLRVENPLRVQILSEKYSALIRSTVYTTKLEAEESFNEQNKELSALVVGLPYLSISDSAVSYTDSDLKEYLNENESQFQQTASRDVELAVIKVRPSETDSNEVRKWINARREKFINAKNDSIFVEFEGSETPFDTNYFGPVDRAIQDRIIKEAVFSAELGEVVGPFLESSKLSLYKISGEKEDSAYTMRAEHVLVQVEGPEKSDTIAALAKARALMAELKAGTKTIAEEATKNYDGTERTQGDLGFTRQDAQDFTPIQAKFKKKLFTQKEGDWFVVASDIGVHVGHVTAGKSNRLVQVAVLSQSITPSTKTDQAALRVATEVLYQAQQKTNEFSEVVESQNLVVQTGSLVEETATQVSEIQEPTQLISWMYENDREEGDVSEVLEFDDMYVIAKLTKIREKGTADFEDIKSTLEVAVLEELKAAELKKQLKEAVATVSTPDELAAKLNTRVRSIPAQKFGAQQVIGMGADNVVLGTIFGMEKNKFSEPVQGTTGVYVVYVNGEIESKNTFNEDISKSINNSAQTQNIERDIENTIREKADIVDKRYRYFN